MLEKARYTSARGVSLVELMVGLAVGLIVLLATLGMYTTTSIGARNTVDSAKLNTEIRGAMDLMVEDIRRAGFCSPGDLDDCSHYNELVIRNYGSGSANCILYSYNLDPLDATSSTEYLGFRIDNAVWMRDGGSGDLSNCTNGSWERLTDPTKVQIYDRQPVDANDPHINGFFEITYQCIPISPTTSATDWSGACESGQTIYDWAAGLSEPAALIETRRVTIDLSGELTRDATMHIEPIQDVLVRNHRVVELP